MTTLYGIVRLAQPTFPGPRADRLIPDTSRLVACARPDHEASSRQVGAATKPDVENEEPPARANPALVVSATQRTDGRQRTGAKPYRAEAAVRSVRTLDRASPGSAD